MSLTATVSAITRTSLHDGPGIRTVVYFKGCALRCRWCHNPENLSDKPTVIFAQSKCIHCGRCVSACPERHVIVGNEVVFRREGCTSCGKCADSCPSGALTVSGYQTDTDSLLNELLKDKSYFDESGGGITLSGGECLLQAAFAAKLLEKCKENGVNTAIETALFVPWKNVEAVLPFTDLVFADLKLSSPEKHKEYTGSDNRLILENLRNLTHSHKNVIIRIPLIPSVNDTAEDMADFAKIINTTDGVSGVELLPYNYLAESKYISAGLTYESFGSEKQSAEVMQSLSSTLKENLQRLTEVFHKR